MQLPKLQQRTLHLQGRGTDTASACREEIIYFFRLGSYGQKDQKILPNHLLQG